MSMRQRPSNSLLVFRPALGLLFKALITTVFTTVTSATPISLEKLIDGNEEEDGTELWILYIMSLALVLLGGAFAGLTIALMGQDGIYLQVLAEDDGEPNQKNAKRVLQLLNKGKHWVLVTLLLSNVIVNETLPVVLDRCFGGGVEAVVGSTVLIVIFGEVVPQSVCVRFGLSIGGYMSKPVLFLMYLMAPIAWPTAKLLDWALGEDHGTVYKKSGLKTLVTLHRNLGDVSERLNQDEVTIIGAVLELKDKPVRAVMTPMDDVFIMSEDTVLDEDTMDMILSAGYSRIPIHESNKPTNFIGMLLVKILITYDPEDCRRVRDFALATLPETRPETSCLDIINFFQEGKSHMVLVSEFPGEDHGAIGVVTLEDVIEELIGEEIIDESDVYVDVHKAIRRLAPAPKARYQRRLSQAAEGNGAEAKLTEDDLMAAIEARPKRVNSIGGKSDHTRELSSSPNFKGPLTTMMRRTSSGQGRLDITPPVPVRANFDELKQHLKHLGPSNPATNPRGTKSTTVKIKPGIIIAHPQPRTSPAPPEVIEEVPRDEEEGDESTSLLRPITPKDGVHAIQQTYGSMARVQSQDLENTAPSKSSPLIKFDEPEAQLEDQATQTSAHASTADLTLSTSVQPEPQSNKSSRGSSDSSPTETASPLISKNGRYVRSGSITENIIESRGIRKVVLETTSSNEEEEEEAYPVGRHRGLGSRSNLNVPSTEPIIEEGDENGLGGGSSSTTAGPSSDAGATGDASTENGQGSGTAGSKKKTRRKKKKGGKS